MSYKDKPQIKLYKYENSAFVLQAIIDDFQEVSFEHNIYEAGTFTITINYNIPNALLFQRGLFCQFGNNPYDFGEIITIQDSIGEDGKGSQTRTITGYDARYILKRRVIKNMNSNGLWVMTDKGELVLRNLIKDQCGAGAEAKRQLPITNTIPASSSAIGKDYSVSEQFSNLYEVCKTIATQSEIGWRFAFDGSGLTLEVYEGTDRSQTVKFDTSFESLANGDFTDSSDSFSNAIYVGGKGQNDDRDIYEGEDVSAGTPSGLDRFESWDNQSAMTTESEYEAEALSMLTQYGQTLTMSGNGLAKCPYVFREEYDIGDSVTVAFSGKSAKAQILSITEHWSWGSYDISFSFGKPQNNLSDQLQLMLRKIQEASNKTNSTDSVRWYTIPTDTAMPKADVTYNTIGFTGTCASGGSTFTLYLDNEKTGAKTYHVYFKQLGGGKLTLTTGKAGATDLVLNSGTYVAIIYVDENGNVTNTASTPTNTIEAGNTQPATSGGVQGAISSAVTPLQPINSVTDGSMKPITSNAVAKGTIQYLDWATYSGNTLGEVILNAMNSLPIIYNTKNNVYSFRGTWSEHGYFQALISNPRTINNYKFNVFVQYSTASASMSNTANGDYIIQVLYNANNTPKFSLLYEQQIVTNDKIQEFRSVYTVKVNSQNSRTIPFGNLGVGLCMGNIDGAGNFAFYFARSGQNSVVISNLASLGSSFLSATLSGNVVSIGPANYKISITFNLDYTVTISWSGAVQSDILYGRMVFISGNTIL